MLKYDLLLAILHYIGLTDQAVCFFKSFLARKCLSVILNGTVSSLQGSIMETLAFAIYISNIIMNITCRNHVHGDDIQPYTSFQPTGIPLAVQPLNEDIDEFKCPTMPKDKSRKIYSSAFCQRKKEDVTL
ncbi:hypothetical protein Trydic_g8295 [Trypoxylus dichotomus]